jgi:hypothetical protein
MGWDDVKVASPFLGVIVMCLVVRFGKGSKTWESAGMFTYAVMFVLVHFKFSPVELWMIGLAVFSGLERTLPERVKSGE